MVANDRRDFSVAGDLREDAFTDLGVLLHLASLVKRQSTRFLEKSRGETDFSDVMHQPREMGLPNLLVWQTEAMSDVASVDCHCGRMTRRVPISCIQGCDEGGGEREVCFLEIGISVSELDRQLSL